MILWNDQEIQVLLVQNKCIYQNSMVMGHCQEKRLRLLLRASHRYKDLILKILHGDRKVRVFLFTASNYCFEETKFMIVRFCYYILEQ